AERKIELLGRAAAELARGLRSTVSLDREDVVAVVRLTELDVTARGHAREDLRGFGENARLTVTLVVRESLLEERGGKRGRAPFLDRFTKLGQERLALELECGDAIRRLEVPARALGLAAKANRVVARSTDLGEPRLSRADLFAKALGFSFAERLDDLVDGCARL